MAEIDEGTARARVENEDPEDYPGMEYPVTIGIHLSSPGAMISFSATYDMPTPEKVALASQRLSEALTAYTMDAGPTKLNVSRPKP